jgi:hypothetical protein
MIFEFGVQLQVSPAQLHNRLFANNLGVIDERGRI